ncbi:MAG: histidine--tRNA ligase [Myxococcota bacterium]|nr:histidine--tRNA ligase [Myxococcota bacterium]
MANVHLPKGMRDLLPPDMRRRLHVIDTVRRVFTSYGFEPLETPAMERIETLTGKYGDEGDKLIFKVLKRGAGGERGEVDQALRYDLTVPLARVIAMNPGLPLPFRRYQVEPVWRADRPQKGRFRQFLQCDVDIVGTESELAEAECLAVVDASLTALGFTDHVIRLNDRRLLRGMAADIGAADQEVALITAIDKIDKIGRPGVAEELAGRGFKSAQIDRVFALLDGAPVPGCEDVVAGLERIQALCLALGVPAGRVRVDPTLARGLDYYTGPVFETQLPDSGVGSVSGGGRYDGLVGMFSGRDIPAVGVSLGLARILLVMEERGMFPDLDRSIDVFVTVFDAQRAPDALIAARAFRAAGQRVEVSYKPGKLGKQFKLAHKRGARFVVVVGPDEAAANAVQLKDMTSGEQTTLPLDEAVARVS